MATMIDSSLVKKYLSLEGCTPFRNVVPVPSADAIWDDHWYRLDNGVFLQISPYRNKNFDFSPEAPFIHGLLVSASDSAAMRIITFDIEGDDGVEAEFPSEILPHQARDYRAIFEAMRGSDFRGESASYRIMSDGKFVHKKIETEKYIFYFRAADISDHERPFAILYKLK